MIIPSRWFAGGKGLDEFRETMLNDHRIAQLVDYPSSMTDFPAWDSRVVSAYFLWDRDYRRSLLEYRRMRDGEPLGPPIEAKIGRTTFWFVGTKRLDPGKVLAYRVVEA